MTVQLASRWPHASKSASHPTPELSTCVVYSLASVHHNTRPGHEKTGHERLLEEVVVGLERGASAPHITSSFVDKQKKCAKMMVSRV